MVQTVVFIALTWPLKCARWNVPQSLFLPVLLLANALALQSGTISGTVSPPKADSVVYVNAVPGTKFPAPKKRFTMNQRNLQFLPHILAVPLGATVEFLNADPRRHNIFWPSVNGDEKKSHNLGTWPQGQTRPFQFTSAGVVPLGCNVHPDMAGFIIVSPTPYYAVTDAAGAFRINDVPDGDYKVSAWQEGLKIQTRPAAVTGTVRVKFTLTK
jgi:plastocyanin